MEAHHSTISALSFLFAFVLVTALVAVRRWRSTADDAGETFIADVPFLFLHDPDWRLMGKALSEYERELGTCLGGLSKSLEVCHISEASLGLKDGFLSQALQTKIDILADLHDSNLELMAGLLDEFPTRKMLTETVFQDYMHDTTAQPPLSDGPPLRTRSPPPSSSYDSVNQIVAHLVRDWTQDGTLVRSSIYDWCRSHVKGKGNSILVPGAGLGRLGWDLARDGHSVETNEVSLTMAAVAYQLFQKRKEFTIYPFVTDFFVNEANSKLRYQSVQVKPPSDSMKGHLSYTIGDFVRLYGSPQASYYDVVVTCFFLDTATNVLEYLAILSNILKKGGQWINVGPLQWHINAHLHPAADELREMILSFGFRIDHWSIDAEPVDYRLEDPTTVRFTKYEGYQPLRMVATKVKDTENRYPIATIPAPQLVQSPATRAPPVLSSVTIEEL